MDTDRKQAPTGRPRAATLKIAHASLQFTDSDSMTRRDVEKIFGRDYDIITGTEATRAAGGTADILREVSHRRGYRLVHHRRYDTWLAVHSSIIKSGWRTGAVHALDRSSKVAPRSKYKWGDKAVIWAAWSSGDEFGSFAVASVHPLTLKALGTGEAKRASDRAYAGALEAVRTALPRNTEMFCGGDFNRNDRNGDVFLGEAKMITAADELRAWRNTGHGAIDAIARERNSERVKALSWRVLSDHKLPLHTDHFLCEATYRVKAL